MIRNSCGFYEYYYTIFSNAGVPQSAGKTQSIGYAVSNSPLGPWWKFTGPIIPGTSNLYQGAPDLGDSAPMIVNGTYTWLGNFDGAGVSSAVAATMPDVTGCP